MISENKYIEREKALKMIKGEKKKTKGKGRKKFFILHYKFATDPLYINVVLQ